MNDYHNIFDAWEAGGVDGMVIGPLTFDSPDLIKISEECEPDPTPYYPPSFTALSRCGGSCRPGHAAAPKDNPPSETYDPNPAVYEAFGVSTPPATALNGHFQADAMSAAAESP